MTKWWWWIVAGVTVLGALLAYLVFRDRDVAELPDLQTEFEAIEAKSKAKKIAALLGEKEALAKIEAEHKETLDAMDDEKKAEAEQLRADPGELARFLVRAGRPTNR